MTKKNYEYYKELSEKIITETMLSLNSPSKKLLESIKYSLLLGGKRLRPILFLATLDLFDCKIDSSAKSLCFMIEALHTYTLIHDDLPCMDDDNFRRGKPTNHIKFGEARALLAGDSLLNLSIEQGLKAISLDANILSGVIYFFNETGINGVIAGQSLEFEHLNPTEKQILTVLEYKTAKLFKASLVLAGIKANASKKDIIELEELGHNFGMAFQLKDDLTDSDSRISNTTSLLDNYLIKAKTNAENLNFEFITDLISLYLE